jgi:polysaccharide pyruvyl transferase WcaK-like protein
MAKILLVSFFRSPNLGDLMLSEMIENFAEADGAEISKFDFNTGYRIKEKNAPPSEPTETERAELKAPLKTRVVGGAMTLLARIAGRTFAYRFYLLLTMRSRRKIWAILDAEAKECDTIVLAGGNMIMDTVWYWPTQFFKYSELARRNQKKLSVIYVGVGPIQKRQSKELFRRAFNSADFISVRDEQSFQQCRELADPAKIVLTADPVFALEKDNLASRSKSIAHRQQGAALRVGLCMLSLECFREPSEYEDYLAAIDKLVVNLFKQAGESMHLTIFSTEWKDYDSVRKIESRILARGISNVSSCPIKSMPDVHQLYAELDLLVGGRMHSLIFAHRFLLPHIGVIWQEKLNGFAQMTNAKDRMFTVAQIMEQSKAIVGEALKLASDHQSILEMNERNSKLTKLVRKGNLFKNSRTIKVSAERTCEGL